MHIFGVCQSQSALVRLIPTCDVCVTFVGISRFFRYCCCILICIFYTHLGQLPYCSFRISRTFVIIGLLKGKIFIAYRNPNTAAINIYSFRRKTITNKHGAESVESCNLHSGKRQNSLVSKLRK